MGQHPLDTAALHLQGIIAAEAGDLDLALASLRQAADTAREDADVALSLSLVQRMCGAEMDAVATLDRAHANAPDKVGVTLALADGLQHVGQTARALEIYAGVLARTPDNLSALVHSGILLMKTGNVSIGVSRLRRAAELSDDPIVLYNQAMAERALGDLDQALEIMDRVLDHRPDYHDASAGKALILHSLGRSDAALDALKPAIDQGDKSTAVGVAYAKIAVKAGEPREASALLRRLLESPGKGAHDIRQLNFALGEIEDARGQFDTAFSAFRSANALTHRRYDATATDAEFASLCSVFSTIGFDRLPRSRVSGGVPVLIVGMPRSGTTLIEQMLDSHPDVAGCGELPDLQAVVEQIDLTSRGSDGRSGLAATEIDQHARRYRKALRQAADQDAPVMVDKMPSNFAFLGYAALLVPNAKVIYCRRDPRDAGLSVFMQNFRTGNAFADDLAAIGHQAVFCHRLMEHWRNVLPLPIIDVDYEKVVADPEIQMRRLLAFLDLPWDRRCLEFHRNSRQVRTASFDQVRQPIHNRSIGRWRNYAKHLSPLIEALQPILPVE